MKTKITIETGSLKDFLSLFDKEEKISDLELGDTWHPSSGFVDQSILKEKNKIVDIIDFDYDFKGLVLFNGNLKSYTLRLLEESNDKHSVKFEVDGSKKGIRLLENKIIEQNAYYPEKYKLKK